MARRVKTKKSKKKSKTANTKNLEHIYSQAFKQHQAGRFQEAEQGYRQALKADPHHFHSTQLLGTLYLQTKRCELGIPLLQKTTRSKVDVTY